MPSGFSDLRKRPWTLLKKGPEGSPVLPSLVLGKGPGEALTLGLGARGDEATSGDTPAAPAGGCIMIVGGKRRRGVTDVVWASCATDGRAIDLNFMQEVCRKQPASDDELNAAGAVVQELL